MLENPHIFSHYFYYIYICVCFYPLSRRIWKETEVNCVDTFPTFIAFSTNLPPSQLLGPSVSFFVKVPSNWVDSSSQYSSGSLDLLIDSSEENQTSLSLIFSFALLSFFRSICEIHFFITIVLLASTWRPDSSPFLLLFALRFSCQELHVRALWCMKLSVRSLKKVSTKKQRISEVGLTRVQCPLVFRKEFLLD